MNLPTNAWPELSPDAHKLHHEACELTRQGNYQAALERYQQLGAEDGSSEFLSLVQHNAAILKAALGEADWAIPAVNDGAANHPEFAVACENVKLLSADEATSDATSLPMDTTIGSATRVAILSFLFNWPSTGGGIIHTVELAKFLTGAGYEVRLFYPHYAPWSIGIVQDSPFPGVALPFSPQEWNLPTIQRRFRKAVDQFDPEFVLITDSWNIKPYLAEAVRGYRTILRLQAMECLCPLNNLRLLGDAQGIRQCPNNQLADPDDCRACITKNGQFSGQLHQLERTLCEVESPGYREVLYRSFREAEAVLTLNQATADLIAPFARKVQVVTWGMDPDRFPKPKIESRLEREKLVLLFAGLIHESIKGFEVLRQACRLLWRERQDFELVVTGELPSDAEPFLRSIGWQTQAELPRLYRESDVVIVPSIAQEGLSRTAVEAMASARPVVGSRLGGLAELIEDRVTGLLARPGDPESLAERIGELLDDPDLRQTIGQNARERFERDFAWPTVIQRDYAPLFQAKRNGPKPPHDPRNDSVSMHARRQLEIGPGEQPLAGFETVDTSGQATYRARWGVDSLPALVGRMMFDEVYASHVLEHVLWNRTQKALIDVYEILKPGGFFEVWVPDFEYIVACYQSRVCGDDWRRDNAKADPMLWINGRIFTYGPEDNNLHHACFDYEHLSNCLSQAGFVEIERLFHRTRGVSHGPIDLGIRCRRPHDESGRGSA